MTDHWVATAQRVAEDTLFPDALGVDRADRIPGQHFDVLAAEGLYGVTAPPELGGVWSDRFDVIGDVVAALAGGCLATTFVWIQHLGPVLAIAAAPPATRQRWLEPLARGSVGPASRWPASGRVRDEFTSPRCRAASS